MPQQLTLYHYDGCAYCSKVKNFMAQSGISIPMKDTHANNVYREELIKIGGKSQVPCLVIDGKALYESNDIIDWLKNNWKNNAR